MDTMTKARLNVLLDKVKYLDEHTKLLRQYLEDDELYWELAAIEVWEVKDAVDTLLKECWEFDRYWEPLVYGKESTGDSTRE